MESKIVRYKSYKLMELPKSFKKIMIFGIPGSGKSVFANRLAKLLGISIYHLDKYFYVENWKERNYDEFLEIQQKIVRKPTWIIDGNSMKSLECRFQNADIAIYFHFPLWLCFFRVFKRLFQKKWHIPDLAKGCTKKVRLRLLKYMIKYHKSYYSVIEKLCNKYPHVKFYIFKSDKDVEQFLSFFESNNR
jgi:adenylate kinase family enzyme